MYKMDYELNDNEKELFKIDSEALASWGLRKLREKTTELNKIKEKADFERSIIQEWEDRQSKSLKADIEYFENHLRQYAESQIAISDKIDTPNGVIRKKKLPVEFIYNSQDLLNYLQNNGQDGFIKIKKTPEWGKFKKTLSVKDNMVITTEGEILDFMEVDQTRYKIELEISEDL